MKRQISLLWLLLWAVGGTQAQDSAYARAMIKELCDTRYAGRGYVNKGQKKAANLIATEMKKVGLLPLRKDYLQAFNLPVNTFPGGQSVKLNGQMLEGGIQYLPDPASKSSKGRGNIIEVKDSAALQRALEQNPYSPILINGRIAPYLQRVKEEAFQDFKGIIIQQKDEKLIWGVRTEQSNMALLETTRGLLKEGDILEWNIKAKFLKENKESNVIGYLPATVPDAKSIIVGAHYDHLGMMGKVMFPGANDNAGGIAMMLDMAKELAVSERTANYYFIAFGGEEAGLIGSIVFRQTRSSKFKDSVIFMLNLDLVATGKDGITAVNALENPQQFKLLNSINDSAQWVPLIMERANAPNSDHYPFARMGIPAFFIYQMDKDYPFYHQPGDRAEAVPLTGYQGTYRLLMTFLQALAEKK